MDWNSPASTALVELIPTAGTCTSVAIGNGRVYVADGNGGVAMLE